MLVKGCVIVSISIDELLVVTVCYDMSVYHKKV